MKFIIGKKLDMTQVWQCDKFVAVTRIQAGPCIVAQVKTDERDGYSAVQVGYGERREKNIAKPQLGHLKKTLEHENTETQKHKNTKIHLRYLREFRLSRRAGSQGEGENKMDLKIGEVINVSTFEVGDKIQVTSTSKGKGFQGVVKRHGFHGQDKTHGNKDQLRMPGSIGATGPAHVFKGQKMPGRMGGDRVTVKGLEIVEVDQENDVLLIKGAVPGARNGLVLIQGEGELKITQKHENTENTKTQKSSSAKATEDKHKNKDEDIEKVVIEAHEKVDGKKSEEKK